jgi:2'-hydroxyisoflavone reductase
VRILCIGGTRFVGRHLAAMAVDAGHRVTVFHRGSTNPGGVAGADEVLGDRDGGLDAVGTAEWDAVVDTSGYVPRVVSASARLFAERADRYVFVSSISVYADPATPGQDESAPVGTLEDPTVEEVTDETYGPLKALCEREVEAAFPGRALVLRWGLMVGPLDPTDRFTYWPRRMAEGGAVLAPGPPEAPVQFADGRDIARWMLSMIERGRTGTFNATGPAEPLSMGRALEACLEATGSAATIEWVPGSFLLEQGVEPWTELPLWVAPEEAGILAVDAGRALAEGLEFRSLEETVADTLAWDRDRGLPDLGAGMSGEREAEVLSAWRAAAAR